MGALKISAIVLLSLGAFIIFIIALFSKRLIRTLLLNAVFGIAAMVIINLTSSFTGVHIPINQWTVGSGAVFGLPGVIGILVFGIFI